MIATGPPQRPGAPFSNDRPATPGPRLAVRAGGARARAQMLLAVADARGLELKFVETASGAVHVVAPAGEERVDAADPTGTDGLGNRVDLAVVTEAVLGVLLAVCGVRVLRHRGGYEQGGRIVAFFADDQLCARCHAAFAAFGGGGGRAHLRAQPRALRRAQPGRRPRRPGGDRLMTAATGTPLDSRAHALTVFRAVTETEARHHTATTFPRNPYQGCERMIRMAWAVGYLTEATRGAPRRMRCWTCWPRTATSCRTSSSRTSARSNGGTARSTCGWHPATTTAAALTGKREPPPSPRGPGTPTIPPHRPAPAAITMLSWTRTCRPRGSGAAAATRCASPPPPSGT